MIGSYDGIRLQVTEIWSMALNFLAKEDEMHLKRCQLSSTKKKKKKK